MTYRVVLRYSATLDDACGSWRLNAFSDGIEYRITVGGVAFAGEIPMRWRRDDPESTFIRPTDADGGVWVSAPAKIGEGLLRRELQLERTPPEAARIMRAW